jgi:prephenate dehydrogenase
MTITAIGLIGGSRVLDLKARGFASHIIGVDSNREDSLSSQIVVLAIPVTSTATLLPVKAIRKVLK